nr:MAG TPA: Leukemia inhibitory factor receptor D2 domain [Caudoviricetes sp.]
MHNFHKTLPLQCVFHSIRLRLTKRLAVREDSLFCTYYRLHLKSKLSPIYPIIWKTFITYCTNK